MARINCTTINRAGIAALPWLVAKFLPGGEILGRDYILREQHRADRQPGFFRVKLFGARAGTWADFATGDRGNDPVSLIAHLEHMSRDDAARLLADILAIVS